MQHFARALALVIAAAVCSPAFAHDYRLGKLHIDHPWARATAGMAKSGAAYMAISNHGEEADRLTRVATPAAKMAKLHAHLMDNGVMKMVPLKAIEIDPGEPTILKPGGLHIMLMGLEKPLLKGESFPLTLTFEQAGSIDVEVVVEGIASMGPHRGGYGDHEPLTN
ncbi:MAG: copper chaperone PCu(A)C [Alphaproteobacteria bacterium]